MRDHSALFGEAFHVLGFLLKEGERNEEGEIGIHMPRLFESLVKNALHPLPHREAMGLDHHAASDGGRFGQVCGPHDLLVPLRIVLLAGR